MTGKTHMMISGAAYEGLLLIGSAEGVVTPSATAVIGGFALATVAGLLPDIDAPGSTITRGTWLPGRFRVLEFVVGAVFMLVALMMKPFIKHRGGTHTLVATAIIGVPAIIGSAMIGSVWIGVALTVGYLFHILADMTTLSGVAILAPFDDKSYRFPLFLGYTRTGSSKELLFVRPLSGVVCMVVLMMAIAVSVNGPSGFSMGSGNQSELHDAITLGR